MGLYKILEQCGVIMSNLFSFSSWVAVKHDAVRKPVACLSQHFFVLFGALFYLSCCSSEVSQSEFIAGYKHANVLASILFLFELHIPLDPQTAFFTS